MSTTIKTAAAVPAIRPADIKGNCLEILGLIDRAAAGGASKLFLPKDCISGVECGDLASQKLLVSSVADAGASIEAAARKAGVEVVFCPKAFPALAGSHDRLKKAMAAEAGCVIQCNPGWGESSTDLVYDGAVLIYGNGREIAASGRFINDSHIVFADCPDEAKAFDGTPESRSAAGTRRHPFIPEDPGELERRCDEIFEIQCTGLATRLNAIGCRNAVIGISGGLDSTLALLVCVAAFDKLGLPRKGIEAVTMPGFGTSGRTKGNAFKLMDGLGVSAREISIADAVSGHLRDIGHDIHDHNVTYENAQARERTQILMDLANDCNGIVVGTGDLSEAALGWCTFNGDHISMYNPNCSVPKTLMQSMVRHAAKGRFQELENTLTDIVETPISPELIPGTQSTEDIVGPYELHDFFIYHFVRLGESPVEILNVAQQAFSGKYDRNTIAGWLKKFLWRFIGQQFKRSCCADGPAVGSVSLSPRRGYAFPSDASSKLWIDAIERECSH